MASKRKQQNISIQPSKVARSSTQLKHFVLGNDNLTEDEINRKSTSDKAKRRIAHVPKHPVPVIKVSIPLKNSLDIPDQKISKQENIKHDNSTKDHNLGNQYLKMKKLKSSIVTIPWAYSEVYHGRTMSQKRKSVELVDIKYHKKNKKTKKTH